jgi:hypothetical protein
MEDNGCIEKIFIMQDEKKGVTMNYFLLSLLALSSSCTYSITMVHTNGEASDVVDEQQAPSTTVTPTVSIPATSL